MLAAAQTTAHAQAVGEEAAEGQKEPTGQPRHVAAVVAPSVAE